MYLAPEDILKGEVPESLLKVETSLEVLQLFKDTYEDYRSNLKQFQKSDSFVRPWDFSPHLVFSRFDQFVIRVKTIQVRNEDESNHALLI